MGEKKKVTNALGQVVGYVDTDDNGRSKVTTFTGKLLGTSDKSGTYNATGKILSRSNVPESLFDLEDDDDE